MINKNSPTAAQYCKMSKEVHDQNIGQVFIYCVNVEVSACGKLIHVALFSNAPFPPNSVHCEKLVISISHHNAAVLLTLLLAVELIAIALAASIFERHTLSSG